jgi:hypothetical protein
MILAISSNPWLDALGRLAVVAVALPVGVILLTWVEGEITSAGRRVLCRLQMNVLPQWIWRRLSMADAIGRLPLELRRTRSPACRVLRWRPM